MIELEGEFTFGTTGTARPFLDEGWSAQESDFFWTVGVRSTLRLPFQPGAGTLLLEFNLTPRTLPPMLRRQRLIVSVNGVPIGEETVGAETPIAFAIHPAALEGRDEMTIQLDCPDAVSPADLGLSDDTRPLGFAIRDIMLFRLPPRPAFARRTRPPMPATGAGIAEAVRGLTGLSMPELAGYFESLGHNCEFGLAQRAMGAEPLGLLRFGGISPHKLAEGLDLEFDGIDDAANLNTYVNEPGVEFIVRDRRYGTHFHTDRKTHDNEADAVHAMFSGHLRILRRKFVEDLRAAEKIFVFQHPEARSVAHVLPFLNLLRSHGPNTLLFVTEGGGGATGTVEQLEADLLHGQVNQFASFAEVMRMDPAPWIHVCANAYRLWRETAALRGTNAA